MSCREEVRDGTVAYLWGGGAEGASAPPRNPGNAYYVL